jgi:hypothetical protein
VYSLSEWYLCEALFSFSLNKTPAHHLRRGRQAARGAARDEENPPAIAAQQLLHDDAIWVDPR